MKVISVGVGFLLMLIILYAFFQYGAIGPVKKITGCYIARTNLFSDKVCLYEGGVYEQFHIIGNDVKKYNESSWKSFSYSSDEGEFIAATLYGYAEIDDKGKIVSTLELDIQPHKTRFGKVLFAIGGSDMRTRKSYIRE